jgi:hypothetical protein
MTDEFHYRGRIIRATPHRSSAGWTHDGVVEHHLGSAVDAHKFCAPGKSRTREEAVKVILVYGQQLLMSPLTLNDPPPLARLVTGELRGEQELLLA